ncbi:MAG: ABC transporter permease, partial [Oscillospiraceae bacterium]|nr:ABC transporter permease [Oscillospiraceae bacterium]
MTDNLGDKLSEQLKKELEAQKRRETMSEVELFSFASFDAARAERTGAPDYSYWRSTLRAFFRNRVAVFFLCLMAFTLLFTFIQPYLPAQKDPLFIHTNEYGIPLNNIPPGEEFWFGTNSIGQDLWARLWAGTRTSLMIGITVTLVEAVLGIAVGVLWGYVRKLDFVLTELYNIMDNIPQTLLLILLSLILKPGVTTIIFALSLTGWLGMARFIRNQIIIIRDRDYNLASRCLGSSTGRIITKNLLPYLVSVITMRMALAIPGAIGSEVFVTYIGIGIPRATPSRGTLIST